MKTKKDILCEIELLSFELAHVLSDMIDERLEIEVDRNPNMPFNSLVNTLHNELINDNKEKYKRLNQLIFFYIHNN